MKSFKEFIKYYEDGNFCATTGGDKMFAYSAYCQGYAEGMKENLNNMLSAPITMPTTMPNFPLPKEAVEITCNTEEK